MQAHATQFLSNVNLKILVVGNMPEEVSGQNQFAFLDYSSDFPITESSQYRRRR
jgi:hypothetical protein